MKIEEEKDLLEKMVLSSPDLLFLPSLLLLDPRFLIY